MNVAVIGFGLIGKERVKALIELKEMNRIPIDKIFVYDKYSDPVWVHPNVFFTENPNLLHNVSHYIFSVPHNEVKDTVYWLGDWEKTETCLIEKPLGRNLKEAVEINDMFKNSNLFVGFNYRFFSGVESLMKDMDRGIFGDIVSVNMTLAHGGSPEDGKTWKLDPIKGAPSSLLDPGIHFLDLLNMMFSNVKPVSGTCWKGFWNTGVQEEVHLLLKADKTIINLQTSLVRWRSSFKIEVNGTERYGVVEGRGRSYGNQTYKIGKRWGWLDENKPQKDTEFLIVTSDCSASFLKEMYDLFVGHTFYNCTGEEAVKDMKLYEECLKVIKC